MIKIETRLRLMIAFIAVASTAFLINFRISADEPAAEGEKRQVSIAIIPFEDKTGSADYSYLAESIQEAVGTEMGKKFKFKSIDSAKVKEVFPDTDITKRSDLDAIKRSAETLNADFLIFGDYVFNATTKQIEMTAQLYLPVIKTNRQLKKIANPTDYTLFSATAKVANAVIIEINSLLDTKTATPKQAAEKKEITAEALIKKDAQMRTGERFADAGNNTILDNQKRLTWQKCTAGLDGAKCENGQPEWINWNSATKYCQSLKLSGKTWRLPTLEELQSIVRAGSFPTIDKTFFPGSLAKNYWTSTNYGSSSSTVWYIAFFEGNAGASGVSSIGYLRCVSDQ